jgi:hypothetical protein
VLCFHDRLILLASVARLKSCPVTRQGSKGVFPQDGRSRGHRLDWALTAQTPEQRGRLFRARDQAVMRGDISELTHIFGACLRSH